MRFRTLFVIGIALNCFSISFAASQNPTVNFALTDFHAQAAASRRLEVYPLWSQMTNGSGGTFTGDRFVTNTTGIGTASITNVQPGAYMAILIGPYLNTTNFYLIPATNGILNAGDYVVPGSIQPGVIGYSRAQADSKFWSKAGLLPGLNTSFSTNAAGVVFIDTQASGGGGSATNLSPWSSDINAAGFSLTNANIIKAASFTGNGAGLTNIATAQFATNALNATNFWGLISWTNLPYQSRAVLDVTKSPFNADPTGVADATPAFRSALLYAAYSNGVPRTVFAPGGKYKLLSTLVLPATSPHDWSMTNALALIGEGSGSTILDASSNTTNDAVQFIAGVTLPGDRLNNFTMKGFSIFGPDAVTGGATSQGAGVFIGQPGNPASRWGGWRDTLEDLDISGFRDGICTSNMIQLMIRNCRSWSNYSRSALFSHGSDTLLIRDSSLGGDWHGGYTGSVTPTAVNSNAWGALVAVGGGVGVWAVGGDGWNWSKRALYCDSTTVHLKDLNIENHWGSEFFYITNGGFNGNPVTIENCTILASPPVIGSLENTNRAVFHGFNYGGFGQLAIVNNGINGSIRAYAYDSGGQGIQPPMVIGRPPILTQTPNCIVNGSTTFDLPALVLENNVRIYSTSVGYGTVSALSGARLTLDGGADLPTLDMPTTFNPDFSTFIGSETIAGGNNNLSLTFGSRWSGQYGTAPKQIVMRAEIAGGMKLGIGTTNPASPLDVNGAATVRGVLTNLSTLYLPTLAGAAGLTVAADGSVAAGAGGGGAYYGPFTNMANYFDQFRTGAVAIVQSIGQVVSNAVGSVWSTNGNMWASGFGSVNDFTNRSVGAGVSHFNSQGKQSSSAVIESDITLSDVTTDNASTGAHGFLKKLDNTATHYMDGTGAWSTPPSGSGGVTTSGGFGTNETWYGVSQFGTNEASGVFYIYADGTWRQTNSTASTSVVFTNGVLTTYNGSSLTTVSNLLVTGWAEIDGAQTNKTSIFLTNTATGAWCFIGTNTLTVGATNGVQKFSLDFATGNQTNTGTLGIAAGAAFASTVTLQGGTANQLAGTDGGKNIVAYSPAGVGQKGITVTGGEVLLNASMTNYIPSVITNATITPGGIAAGSITNTGLLSAKVLATDSGGKVITATDGSGLSGVTGASASTLAAGATINPADAGALTNINAGSLTGYVHTVNIDGSALWPADTATAVAQPTWYTNAAAGYGFSTNLQSSMVESLMAWAVSQTATNRWKLQVEIPQYYGGGAVTAAVCVVNGTNSAAQSKLGNVWSVAACTMGAAMGTPVRFTNNLAAGTSYCETNWVTSGITIGGTPAAKKTAMFYFESDGGSPSWTSTNNEWLVSVSLTWPLTNAIRSTMTVP